LLFFYGGVAQFCAWAISVISTVDIWINRRDSPDGQNKTNTFSLNYLVTFRQI